MQIPIGIGKSTSYDAHDGDDDEMQRFSKWGTLLSPERETVRRAGSMRSARRSTSDAGVKLGVPTSSRTFLPAGIEIAVPLGRKEPVLLNTPHPRSDPKDLGERRSRTRTRRSRS